MFKKPKFVFNMMLIIFIQTLAALTIASLVLLNTPAGTFADNIYIGDTLVEGMTVGQAQSTIENRYLDLVSNVFKVVVNEETYTKPYKELDLKLDISTSIETAYNQSQANQFQKIMKSKNKKTVYPLKIFINDASLKEFANQISSANKIDPKDAVVNVEDYKLIRIKEQDGAVIDSQDLFNEMKNHLSINLNQPLMIDNRVFTVLKPQKTLEYYSNAQKVISYFSLNNIADSEMTFLNKVINENKVIEIKDNTEFSMMSSVEIIGELNNIQKEALSKLFTAVLNSTNTIDGITFTSRKAMSRPQTYIEPGMEAVYQDEEDDLKFINESGSDLFLFIDVANNQISTYIAGKNNVDAAQVKSIVKQEIAQPEIIKESLDLVLGEQKVISEGIPGKIIDVYRIFDGKEELLYTQRYEGVPTIIEIGAGVENGSGTRLNK